MTTQAAASLEILSIAPAPTDAERAAIAAAVEALGPEIWPDLGAATIPAPSPRWPPPLRRLEVKNTGTQ